MPIVSTDAEFVLRPVGQVRSSLRDRNDAPKQGGEGAPEAWVEVRAPFVEAIHGLEPGQEIFLLTWLHLSRRDVLRVHPRGNPATPLTGVFATRSPDRPNPIGLHRVTVLEIAGTRLRVGPLEAVDGTPVVDLKPVLPQGA
jgi:tRNA-Thr(GGU) m(6)t(6)A37 methyltransferase TsaA